MTCIVGYQHKGKVWIGGDSAGVGGLSLTVRADRKVFQNKQFIMGFTTSFRMGQLLQYRFKPPSISKGENIETYMCTKFIDGVRKCFNTYKFGYNKNGDHGDRRDGRGTARCRAGSPAPRRPGRRRRPSGSG